MKIKDKFPGFHHAYLGLLLILIGFFMLFGELIVFSLVTILLGLYLLLDDIYQHLRQRFDINYHSPLHMLYVNTIARNKYVKILNKWVDKLMGRK